MKDYETLTTAGQVRRLREVAISALANYPLRLRRIWPLHHGHNTTFAVEATTDQAEMARFVLRTSLPGWRLPPHLGAELAFLRLVRQKTSLVVPQPVATRDGSFVAMATARGVPGERSCVLFRWLDGQFFRRRLSLAGMRRVGRFTAALHNFASTYAAELAGLPRPSVQWERRAGLDGDMERVMQEAFARGALLPPSLQTLFVEARQHVKAVMDSLGYAPDRWGLIHADLHQGNLLHHKGGIRAIDFDDLGWGHYLYDLAVTQWYFRRHPHFQTLRSAHLFGYRQGRPFSAAEEELLPNFVIARTLMMACYIAGRADHPRFRRWAPEFVKDCAGELDAFLHT